MTERKDGARPRKPCMWGKPRLPHFGMFQPCGPLDLWAGFDTEKVRLVVGYQMRDAADLMAAAMTGSKK
jgi:hypothetical protein